MKEEFVRANPDAAKKLVWAHMDAMNILKDDPDAGIGVLQHYNDKMDPRLIRQAYGNCSWQYPTVPRAWIETLAKWEREDNIIQRDVTYEEVTNFSMRDSYPGPSAWSR
jgi:ABC-type nitrate/sulfonate/bicarbonate transport system substrate-binding protein